METYNRVRQLANEHRLSIAEVERRAKLAPQTIGNWRRVKPSGEALGKVATVFNTTVDYLLGRTDNFREITPDNYELLSYYNRLSRMDQRWIFGMMTDLIKKANEETEVPVAAGEPVRKASGK